jgi:hypothetical protein
MKVLQSLSAEEALPRYWYRNATSCDIAYSSFLYAERLVTIRMNGLLMLSLSANFGEAVVPFSLIKVVAYSLIELDPASSMVYIRYTI